MRGASLTTWCNLGLSFLPKDTLTYVMSGPRIEQPTSSNGTSCLPHVPHTKHTVKHVSSLCRQIIVLLDVALFYFSALEIFTLNYKVREVEPEKFFLLGSGCQITLSLVGKTCWMWTVALCVCKLFQKMPEPITRREFSVSLLPAPVGR